MTDILHIPADARETVWVFALDLPPAEAAAFVEGGPGDNWPLKSILGAERLRARHIESFAAQDLAGVGLPGYLVEGLGVDAPDVEPHRDALDGADHHIVILHADAFDGIEQTLTPRLPVHHLGTFRKVQTEQRLVPLPGTGVETIIPPSPGVAPAPQNMSRGGRGIVGLLAAAAIVLVLAYLISGSGQ